MPSCSNCRHASSKHTLPVPSSALHSTRTAPADRSAAALASRSASPPSSGRTQRTTVGARPPGTAALSNRASGGKRRWLSRTMGWGEGPAPSRRTLSKGSSARTVPTPTRMASTAPRKWCVKVMDSSPLSATGHCSCSPPGVVRLSAIKPSSEVAKLSTVKGPAERECASISLRKEHSKSQAGPSSAAGQAPGAREAGGRSCCIRLRLVSKYFCVEAATGATTRGSVPATKTPAARSSLTLNGLFVISNTEPTPNSSITRPKTE
mmetsp:Transcript_1082/g.2615  ORF Transcript_1082/g.2615 Transcript_1082/m.2615 type:complete len:264 (-) Transcript_1082:837-1628(-)